MLLVLISIPEIHNQTNKKCLPNFVQMDVSSGTKTANQCSRPPRQQGRLAQWVQHSNTAIG